MNDLTIEISEWCYFEAESCCKILNDNPPCEFGRIGEPAKECPLREGRIILEWKDE